MDSSEGYRTLLNTVNAPIRAPPPITLKFTNGGPKNLEMAPMVTECYLRTYGMVEILW